MTLLLQQAPRVRVGMVDAGFTAVSHGARVKDTKPAAGDDPGNYPNPSHVFLIYISQNQNNKWIVRHMYASIITDVQNTADILFGLAKSNTATPYRVGDSFVNLIWKEPCYIYLVLDLDNTHFINDDAPEFDPIQFYDRKPILNSGPAVYINYDANYSFYNGTFETIVNRSAFRCINYLKDETGGDLRFPQVRYYGFKILFNAPYIDGTIRPHDIDPDGQNQGPPVVPAELEVLAA